MQDTISTARTALEDAEDALAGAEQAGAPAGVLDDLTQRIADAEQAYYRACDDWEPDGYDRNGAYDGFHVYSDADPGL